MNDPGAALPGQNSALLPLRAFLGITYCFAGLQKLANPSFIHASSPISIQAQLASSRQTSPIHGLLAIASHIPVVVGLLIAGGELAVGLATLTGLWTRAAAAGGMALSLAIFLSISYHSSPYYTGSDIVFLFAWTPLLIARARIPGSRVRLLHPTPRHGAHEQPSRGGRNGRAVAPAAVGLAGLLAAVGTAVLGRLMH